MLEIVENITLNGVHFYQDNYVKDNKIIHGGKGEAIEYIIANEKTINLIKSEIKKDLRIKKLNEILELKEDSNNVLTLEKIIGNEWLKKD